jgi:hypothetical protein
MNFLRSIMAPSPTNLFIRKKPSAPISGTPAFFLLTASLEGSVVPEN